MKTLKYSMFSNERPELVEVNRRATGSDLIYGLAELAVDRGYRLFLLGGPPGIADNAARCLEERYPGLPIAGTACPPHRELEPHEQEALLAQIQDARPDLLLIAFGQPIGELWIDQHLDLLGVPVCVQVGASLDFVAGRIRRAPHWIQKVGMEWAYRISREPRRLAPRYARNGGFLMRMTARDIVRSFLRRGPGGLEPSTQPELESVGGSVR